MKGVLIGKGCWQVLQNGFATKPTNMIILQNERAIGLLKGYLYPCAVDDMEGWVTTKDIWYSLLEARCKCNPWDEILLVFIM